MQEYLYIAIIQTQLIWENPSKNRELISEKVAAIKASFDLIVLPEMFTTGFTMQPEKVAESMNGTTIKWLKELANKYQSAITGSLIIKEDHCYYNRLVFVIPDGEILWYNKRHAFTLAGEDKVFTSGTKKLVVNYKGWRICPLICYDLRFPVWSRYHNDYDVLLYVANWPKPRINAWNTLLKARAIENMSYCVGVNRIGTDINGYEYTGNSAAYNCLGKQISTVQPDQDTTEVILISKKHLQETRERFQFLEDRDSFIIKN